MFDLKNKRVLITGASSGIGRQLAIELAAFDTQLILLARRKEQLEKVKNEIIAQFPELHPPRVYCCNVADETAVKNTITKATKDSNPIDILINNAGIGVYGPIKNTAPEDFRRLIEVNFLGAVNLTYHSLSHFPENSKGMIVFISSVASLYGIPCYSAYSASKAALKSFSQTLRSELADSNIEVLHVSPDYTRTGFFRNEKFLQGARLRRDKMARVENVARDIIWQIRHRKKETTLSMRGTFLTKGKAIFPGLVRYYFRKRASKLLKS